MPLSKPVYSEKQLCKLVAIGEALWTEMQFAFIILFVFPTFTCTVTVVGKVRRSSPRAATQSHPAYRIRVNKVLRGAEAILRGRKLMTVVLPPTQNPTLRLLQDTTYIITGINIDNKLIFADHNLIQTHSNELEDLIQTC